MLKFWIDDELAHVFFHTTIESDVIWRNILDRLGFMGSQQEFLNFIIFLKIFGVNTALYEVFLTIELDISALANKPGDKLIESKTLSYESKQESSILIISEQSLESFMPKINDFLQIIHPKLRNQLFEDLLIFYSMSILDMVDFFGFIVWIKELFDYGI